MKRSKTLMFATWEVFRNWYAYIKLRFTNLKLRLARITPGLNQKVLVVISYQTECEGGTTTSLTFFILSSSSLFQPFAADNMAIVYEVLLLSIRYSTYVIFSLYHLPTRRFHRQAFHYVLVLWYYVWLYRFLTRSLQH